MKGLLFLPTPVRSFCCKRNGAQTLSSANGPYQGRIRIGIYSILNTVIIPPLLVRFKKKHPDIEISSIHGHYQALENSLSKNNLDLIVCVQDKDNPLFDCIHLKREHFLLAIPPEHPACHKAVKMEDLTYPYLDIRELNQDCIFSNIPTNKSAGRKTNCLKSAGFTLRKSKKWKAFSSPSSLLLKNLVWHLPWNRMSRPFIRKSPLLTL